MECTKLLDSLDELGYAGICVGAEHSQMLENSLLILQQENHFRKCYYWGVIYGLQSDYHIAFGYKSDCMNDQIYYYSKDGLTWFLLPKADKCARFLTPLAINKFEGDPSIVTNVYNVNPPFPPNEDEKKYYDGPIPQELKEEDRLAATVELIREDAAVIPRGAWFKRPAGDVIENISFEGLSTDEATYFKSYVHARPPQQKWNSNLLSRPDYNYAVDFLDTIDLDVPRGCWNLQLLLGKQMAILHSLQWTGMTFYHRLNTPHYGSLYVGHGKRNMDIAFMV